MNTDARLGIEIPGYQLEECIVAHHGTSVHRGRGGESQEPRILKIVLSVFAPPDAAIRLEHECELLRTVQVAQVPRVQEFVRFDGGSALVIEDMGPASLGEHLKADGPLDVDVGLAVAIDLIRTLGEVHEQGVIHKDVNPDNIVWCDSMTRPALVDFGISTTFSHHRSGFTAVPRIEGTLPYIAPEQTGRMNRELDSRADFYSFGATLYELFTGVQPFDERDPLALIHAHLALIPRLAHQVNPRVPEALSRIIAKLLAKSAEQRYQGAPI